MKKVLVELALGVVSSEVICNEAVECLFMFLDCFV
jgi:hypothetical protein